MKLGFAALLVFGLMASAPVRAAESGCQSVRLTVDPVEKAAAVAAVLRRRLESAGAATVSVEPDGSGLRALLPVGVSEAFLTRPGRIEFHLVADKPDAPGASPIPRLNGGAPESVEGGVILDETHLREIKVRTDPADGAVALAFHFDPRAMKNMMAATTEAIGRKLAILVDDVIVADPIIRAPVAAATGEISAGFTLESANQLSQLLQNGRLPARVAVATREPCPTP